MIYIKLSTTILFMLSILHPSFSGTNCPPYESIRPCFCSVDVERQLTTVICAGVNSTQLHKVTSALKSMIIDRFMLLGAFRHPSSMNILLDLSVNDNEVETDESEDAETDHFEMGMERLPKKWLSSVRVKVIEIQDSSLSSCFLCDEPLFGQGDFLTTLIVTNSGLKGHLCNSCNTKISYCTTKDLQKAPNLQTLDLSHNSLKVITGVAFPELRQLKTLVLTYNRITKINDKAFENLPGLSELDLSHNRLSSISRKMFREIDNSLKVLDLSWNSILSIPETMFYNLRVIKEVKLANNLLEVLSETTFSRVPTVTERIDVRGNFLVCNCSLSWIVRKLNRNTKLYGKCVAPKEVELQDVKANLATLQTC